MQKIYKEYQKAQKSCVVDDGDIEPLSELFGPSSSVMQHNMQQRKERELSWDEKQFLLAAERGDIGKVKKYLEEAHTFEKFSINAVDPLGRSALYIAIEYENIEMIAILLENHVDVGEALLHAINEEFVEAVEMLLNYQDHGGNLTDVKLKNMK
jgi:transient receptor potential cation channel subfamily C protein 4